jgi:hypothetical protein
MGYNESYHIILQDYLTKHEIDKPRDVATLGHLKFAYSVFDKITNFDIIDTNTIFDLNTPLPEEFQNKFDLVIDGGTLEHIMDTQQCLKNITKMLKIKGLVYHMNPQDGRGKHGFYQFSTDFYTSYYGNNGFTRLYHSLLIDKKKPKVSIRKLNCFIAQKEQNLIATNTIIQPRYKERHEKIS